VALSGQFGKFSGCTVSLICNPGIPQRLDGEVTRIVAPNAGVMDGPGNQY